CFMATHLPPAPRGRGADGCSRARAGAVNGRAARERRAQPRRRRRRRANRFERRASHRAPHAARPRRSPPPGPPGRPRRRRVCFERPASRRAHTEEVATHPDEGFACDMRALTKAERTQHGALARELFAAVLEKRELEDGYALRLPSERWLDTAKWAELERK